MELPNYFQWEKGIAPFFFVKKWERSKLIIILERVL
jgi:hypothetical protein